MEITGTYVFDAPRERVWEAWTDPKLIAQWWGPKGFTNPLCEWEARPGGSIRVDMTPIGGAAMPMKGNVVEVVPPERMVIRTTAFEDAQGNPQLELLTAVFFDERNGQTVLRLHGTYTKVGPTAAEAMKGGPDGWGQSFDKLAELLAKK